MLKIGTCDDELSLWRAEHTRQELTLLGIENETVVFPVSAPAAIEHALLRGAIDLSVHAMSELPTSLAERALVITAVSRRFTPSDLLLTRKESYSDSTMLKLAADARVGVSTPRQKAQLSALRPDLRITETTGNAASLMPALQAADFDALILPAVDVSLTNFPDLLTLELPAREYVPAPAQGVIVWVCNRDDFNCRSLLKKIHHPEVSACTNVERRVLQLLESEHNPAALGVYCEQDAAGNYHAFAVCETNKGLRRARLSSSTRIGLAEKLVQQLNS